MEKNNYLFLITKKKDIIDRAKEKFNAGNFGLYSDSSFCFKSNVSPLLYFSSLNDVKDYSLERLPSHLAQSSVTLISYAKVDEDCFSAATDFWGIQNHFYYQSDDTFGISNNVFLLKSVISEASSFSKESLFDYLFFSAPLGARTWYSGIHCLFPGQRLQYRIASHELMLSNHSEFDSAFSMPSKSIVESAAEFYEKVKKAVDGELTYLSLSSGSDSRLILAALRHFGFNFRCTCFGTEHYAEKEQITDLAEKFHIPLDFLPFSEYETKFEHYFLEGMKRSNGFLNPLRTHYVEYYSKLPQQGNYFEGILGSEFVKGEISCPTMTSWPMKEIIADGQIVKDVIEKYYGGLDEKFKTQFKQYVQDTYSDLLVDINTKRGLKSYAGYLFDFIPSKVFSGLILLVKDKLKAYYPYLHPSILAAVFQQNYGIKAYASIAKKHPLPSKTIFPQALIVKEFDKELFTSKLDRGVSFRDSLFNQLAAELMRLKSRILWKFFGDHSKFAGQIDNSNIERKIMARAREIVDPIVISKPNHNNFHIAKAIVTYNCLKRCERGNFKEKDS